MQLIIGPSNPLGLDRALNGRGERMIRARVNFERIQGFGIGIRDDIVHASRESDWRDVS